MRYYILSFLIFITSCHSIDKINFDTEDLREIKKTMLNLEKIEKTILTEEKFKTMKVQFGTNGKKISLFYSKLNKKNEVFSFIESIDSLPGINKKETSLLKENILFLHNKGLSFQEFFSCDGDIEDKNNFYTYKHNNKVDSEPENIIYFSILTKEILSSKCFNSLFEIIEQKEGLYLLKRVNW